MQGLISSLPTEDLETKGSDLLRQGLEEKSEVIEGLIGEMAGRLADALIEALNKPMP